MVWWFHERTKEKSNGRQDLHFSPPSSPATCSCNGTHPKSNFLLFRRLMEYVC